MLQGRKPRQSHEKAGFAACKLHTFISHNTSLRMTTMRLLCTFISLLGLCVIIHGENRLLSLNTVDEYLNVCMDGTSHKQTPGPESTLFQQCEPWRDRSCCTEEISQNLHVSQAWYNLNWNHCSQNLSAKCRGRFIQDLCFYECSPNLGPWLVKVDGMKIRNERFVDAPLCRQECDAWWEDCKEDFTCIDNWSRGFNWSSGFAACPNNKPCVTIEQMFQNSSNFCERVWDHSWKVVEDDHPGGCFVMWWEQNQANPNQQVAEYYAEQIVSAGVIMKCNFFTVLFSALPLFFSWCLSKVFLTVE